MLTKNAISFTVDYRPTMPAQTMSMQYMVAIIVGCVVFVALVALVFVCCCCCRRRNNKLKNKTADMEVSHRSVVTQQVRQTMVIIIIIIITVFPYLITQP